MEVKPAPMMMTAMDEFLVMENILESLSMYLHELHSDVKLITGTDVDVTTICRFLKNNFSRKKLSHIALQRNCELKGRFI